MTLHGDRIDESAIKSYRYLRLAMVVMVLALAASVLIERAHAECWEESISAFYYTPVHAVFVGALVAIGVCLIVVKGSSESEDMLLNIAGMLAPVVAFVPTSPSARTCGSALFVRPDPDAFINNNVLALGIGGLVAIGIAYVAAFRQGKVRVGTIDRTAGLGLAITVVLVGAGLVWYWKGRSGFLEHAHGTTALAMFVAIGVVVIINARRAGRKYRPLYFLIASFMVAAGLAVFIGTRSNSGWRHAVLWVEALEIAPFAVFWTAQTLEHWQGGIGAAPPDQGAVK